MKKVDIEEGGYWKKVAPALLYVRPCQMSESEYKKLKHHCWEQKATEEGDELGHIFLNWRKKVS